MSSGGLKLAAEQCVQRRLQLKVTWISTCRKGGTRLNNKAFKLIFASLRASNGLRLFRIRLIFFMNLLKWLTGMKNCTGFNTQFI